MTSSKEEKAAEGATAAAESGGSMMPTILAGAGILVIAGLMIFWPDSAKDAPKARENAIAQGKEKPADDNRGGVPAREADEAEEHQAGTEPKVHPAVRTSAQFGMSNNPPSREPPEFETNDEELAYWELQLSEAHRVLKMRERAIERIPEMRERMKNSADPEGSLAQFERREQVIHENLAKQKEKVAKLEEKVAALKEGG